MKLMQLTLAMLLATASLTATAQTKIPEGYKKGSVTLFDNTVINGYIRENLGKSASICVLDEKGENKLTYDAGTLLSAEIDNVQYISVKGDFFKVLSTGNSLGFLQKASSVPAGPVYNGAEVVGFAGNEGKAGDYFIFNKKTNDLKRVTKKTFEAVVAESFAGCTAAIEKAHAINNDIPQLKGAVDIFNSETK